MELKRMIATFLIINLTFLLGIFINILILTLLGVKELNILATINILIIMFIVDVTFFIFIKNQRLKEQKQSEFITNTIHTIRTPLSVITACTEILSLDVTNDYIDKIKNEVKKVDKFSSDLMKYSILRENIYSKCELVNVGELLKEECKVSSVSLMKNNKVLNYSIEDDVIWNVNKDQLLIAFKTLLDNAMKYSLNFVDCTLTANLVKFTNDTTLDDGDYSFLFERFERNQNDKQGYGVGLSIVKTICDRYKLKIKAIVDNKQMIITLLK